MFRIDRNYVHLAATRTVQLDSDRPEADAEGSCHPDAAASINKATTQSQEIISRAKEKAARIIEDARNEVAELLLDEREKAEEHRRDAWKQGYTEGSEEGRRAYDEQLAVKQRENDESLKRVLDELYEERSRTYDTLEAEAVALALEIVRKVINPVGEEFGGVFQALIKNALKQINPDRKVVIRVGPSEFDRFFPSGNAVFKLQSGTMVTASILRDASIEEGGCIVDTGEATVNIGVDSQLKYISLAFDRAKFES